LHAIEKVIICIPKVIISPTYFFMADSYKIDRRKREKAVSFSEDVGVFAIGDIDHEDPCRGGSHSSGCDPR